MCVRRRILSFVWSERLVSLLAKQGGDWEVVPRISADREAPWRLARQLPRNVAVVSRARALGRLGRGDYDLVVGHGLPDLRDASVGGAPVLFVMSGTPVLARALGVWRELQDVLHPGSPSITPVFFSEASRQEWGSGGEVVPLGLDIEDYGPYTGDRPRVLVVAHLGGLLPETVDASLLERSSVGLPVTRIDRANQETFEAHASGRPWILDAYAQHRVLLDTSPPWCRDANHLSVLEAMASGQPVVTIPKPDGIVVDGINGFVSDDGGRMHQRLLELLSDRELACQLGSAARRTVAARFPAAAFRERWRGLVDALARPPVAAA